MVEFYPEIRLLHIACVVASGSLFTLRGCLMLVGSGLANHAALRYTSYAIDGVLLAAALLLVSMLRLYPFVEPWLTVKLLLLVVYIVLGIFALRRGRTRAIRAGFFAAALSVFLFMYSIARAHHPLGVFAGLPA